MLSEIFAMHSYHIQFTTPSVAPTIGMSCDWLEIVVLMRAVYDVTLQSLNLASPCKIVFNADVCCQEELDGINEL
jgi:hypothetical protein